MKLYSVDQGEGVAGPYIKIGAITTALYSCMGILMINRSTKRAGLYHYPAEKLQDDRVQFTIMQMTNDLNPSEIIVTPAVTQMGQGSSPSDQEKVVKYLKLQSAAKVSLGEERGNSNFWWKDETLHLNEQPDDSATSREGMEQHANEFDFSGRKMTGDVWYYGMNMEKNK